MRLVENKVEYIPQGAGFKEMEKHIERCGKVCYKSESNITEDSADKFIEGLKKNKHLSVLEHGTVYLTIPLGDQAGYCSALGYDIVEFFDENPYSKVNRVNAFTKINVDGEDTNIVAKIFYITTNYRVIREIMEDRRFQWDEIMIWRKDAPSVHHEKRHTFKFTTSMGVGRELLRHRLISPSQESTRFCNYSKDKFNNELAFIRPQWAKLNSGHYKIIADEKEDVWNIEGDGYLDGCADTPEEELLLHYMNCEQRYLELLGKGLKPQDAREVLPLGLKTEIVMTGFESDWKDLLDKRLYEKTGKVAPDMKDLMKKLYKVCEENEIARDLERY